MGKTYHRQKPADIDRSHALKPEKTKVRLNPRDIFDALDESAEEHGYEPYPMMPGESDDPYVYVPGIGGRTMGGVLPFSKGRGGALIR